MTNLLVTPKTTELFHTISILYLVVWEHKAKKFKNKVLGEFKKGMVWLL